MKKILNPAKPIHAWTLDGTKVGVFPSSIEAVTEFNSSRWCINNAARRGIILEGKYLLSYNDAFPGVPAFSKKNTKHVWVWDTECKPLGDYPSHSSTGKALGITPQSVRDSMALGNVVRGKYLFTASPEPPVLSQHQLNRILNKRPKQKPIAPDRYTMEELKWVSLGEFTEMEDAAKASELSPRTIRRMLLNGKVYHKIFRARMKGKKVCIEKREWSEAGKGKTLTELAARVKITPHAASTACKVGGVIAGKYRIFKTVQPIPEPTV